MSGILVVDDEKSIRVTLAAFLHQSGYSVETAGDAAEALEILQTKPMDVLLTDIVMPQYSGLDLVENVRKTQADIQIILMTGDPSVETAVQAIQEGVFDYLSKPVRKQDLIQVVQRAIQVKKALDAKRLAEEENLVYRQNLEKMVRERTVELLKSEQRFRDYVTSAPDGIFIWDEYGIIQDVNPAGLNLLNQPLNAVIGKNIAAFHTDADQDRVIELLKSLVTEKQVYWEANYPQPDDQTGWWSVSAGALGMGGYIAFVQNITERRRMEEELRISEERFRVALKSIPLVIAHSDLNLRYTWIHTPSQGFRPADYLGHTDEEISTDPGAKELLFCQLL